MIGGLHSYIFQAQIFAPTAREAVSVKNILANYQKKNDGEENLQEPYRRQRRAIMHQRMRRAARNRASRVITRALRTSLNKKQRCREQLRDKAARVITRAIRRRAGQQQMRRLAVADRWRELSRSLCESSEATGEDWVLV